jgi:hypothetical protein
MSKTIKSTKIRGKRWNIDDVNCLPVGDLGQCDYNNHTLNIPYDGDQKEELDVIIHETIHAGFPDLIEQAVDEFATDLANLLWKLGWRKEI